MLWYACHKKTDKTGIWADETVCQLMCSDDFFKSVVL